MTSFPLLYIFNHENWHNVQALEILVLRSIEHTICACWCRIHMDVFTKYLKFQFFLHVLHLTKHYFLVVVDGTFYHQRYGVNPVVKKPTGDLAIQELKELVSLHSECIDF